MARPYWTPDALESLEALAEYVAVSSPGYAGRFVSRLIDAVEVLERFPELGRSVPEFEDAPFRELVFQNYRIVYELIDGRPWILLIAHGAVDLRAEFKRRGIEHD